MYVLLAGTSIVSKIQMYKIPINSAELQRLLLANERKQGDMIICPEHLLRGNLLLFNPEIKFVQIHKKYSNRGQVV